MEQKSVELVINTKWRKNSNRLMFPQCTCATSASLPMCANHIKTTHG